MSGSGVRYLISDRDQFLAAHDTNVLVDILNYFEVEGGRHGLTTPEMLDTLETVLAYFWDTFLWLGDITVRLGVDHIEIYTWDLALHNGKEAPGPLGFVHLWIENDGRVSARGLRSQLYRGGNAPWAVDLTAPETFDWNRVSKKIAETSSNPKRAVR